MSTTTTVKIRKPYEKRMPSRIMFNDESRTKQCFKDECDINTVLSKADRTGLITHVNTAKAEYGDFTAVNEYHEAMNTVVNAQSTFDMLPSAIRKRFGNDPGAFFEFATNPDNVDEMAKMGLANAPEVASNPAPVDPAPVDPAPAEPIV